MTLRDHLTTINAALRVLRQCPPRLVWKFMVNFAWRSMKNIRRFEKRQANAGPFFPAFVMISVTERCNLSCRGCWISRGGQQALSLEQIAGIIETSKKKGSFFFGILGGEPLLYKGLLDLMEQHTDCYFQLFTNAILLTEEVAKRLRKMGNVTPLISIEGLKEESDARRGKQDVYARTLAGVRNCHKAGLIFGAAASICKSNFGELVNRDYVDLIAKEGAHYLWYYIYRPVGEDPNAQNALDKEQIRQFRKFVVEQRCRAPLFIIETYWDADGNALCPGATGMSHHIAPSGGVEFCPPLQLAAEFLNEDASNLASIFEHSTFLADLRTLTATDSRGCILMDNPQRLVEHLVERQADDTTSRQTVMAEYRNMKPVAGHDMKGEEIPEISPYYRWIKKRYFFGFGAYG